MSDETVAAAWSRGVPPDFSMVLGGPLYQLFRRLHIVRGPLELLTRRIIVISMLAWLPLLVLSIAGGRAVAVGGLKASFLNDISAHARFLLALPLLIIAELVVHTRFRPLIGQFVVRDLIAPADLPRFEQIIDSCMRWRNSIWGEVILLIVVFTGGQFVSRTQGLLPITAWYADHDPSSGLHFTAAGKCYVYWSLPLFQFILARWYLRVVIWSRFLWKVSRMNLKLIPTHPDRAGGLGFLAGTAHAMAPLLVAQSVVVAGVIADHFFFEGKTLLQFKLEMVAVFVLSVAMALGPLIVFAPVLLRCQREGLREYGVLASRYVAAFQSKWLGREPNPEEMLGTSDIQSLADLGGSYEIIQEMRVVPFGRRTFIQLALMSALPFLPLTLTEIPLDELLNRLFKALL